MVGINSLNFFCKPWPTVFSLVQSLFSVSWECRFKSVSFSVLEKQEGNTLVVEAVIIPSPRENVMIKSEPESKACPLCRLNLDVKHTVRIVSKLFLLA